MSTASFTPLDPRDEEGAVPELDDRDDRLLVEQAKAGDREAFGELIRRHRAQVYGYARSIAQEPFLAEDIVQDALIRAFLHLGTLVDTERFLPWLHRIVRNQAYTRLRSRSVAKEQSFSALAPSQGSIEPSEDTWRDLDYILHRLSQSRPPAGQETNPEEALLRRELMDTIGGILGCLNRRERQIFESHFFDHLSPQEIAKLFQLSSANVYQIISRGRKKVIQEKLRISVDHYMKNRRDMGLMKKTLLPNNAASHEGGTWTSAASAIHRILGYTDKAFSLPMVMGLTGHAFRINIGPGDVHIGGPTSFNFGDILTKGLLNLGFRCRFVDGLRKDGPGPNANLVDPSLLTEQAMHKRSMHKALPEALELIHRSIDRGLPVLSWDLFIPEFGVIYGYDDEQRQLMAAELCREKAISYDNLGRGILEDLFILAIEDSFETDDRTMLQGALRMILDHYQGIEEEAPRTVRGLAAYSTWIEAFRGGAIEPNGHSYNVAFVQDARHFAAAFWNELADGWNGSDERDARIRSLFREAAVLYGDIARRLLPLRSLFPFPSGGDPNSPAAAEQAVPILESVLALERQAVSLLEAIDNELRS
ncbi:RNA polymerase sigma factor [Paenibacillus sp. 32352]|uniref:RNA polymerase sigma factor n=1 Tax=Paenibacillus sp. 32352 TaxID=1969111 RepID=UPI002118F825|nr:RNA polymerase sigma factor [Paenibacillus sp. 32352]